MAKVILFVVVECIILAAIMLFCQTPGNAMALCGVFFGVLLLFGLVRFQVGVFVCLDLIILSAMAAFLLMEGITFGLF